MDGRRLCVKIDLFQSIDRDNFIALFIKDYLYQLLCLYKDMLKKEDMKYNCSTTTYTCTTTSATVHDNGGFILPY